MKVVVLSGLALLLSACGAREGGIDEPVEAFDGIAASETVYLAGTEPFWSAELSAGEAIYTTPENSAGTRFPVQRFSGLNGIGFSGQVGNERFDATVTPGECSDGMSDRVYPFTATVLIGTDQRLGCAWTDAQPFVGPEAP